MNTIAATATLLLASLVCAPREPLQGPDSSGGERTARNAKPFDHRHLRLTEVLQRVVRGDEVDYRALKRDPSGLRAYLAELEALEVAQLQGWSEDQRHAFWINVYNAYTLDLVARNYPVASIKDLGSLLTSVWKKEFIPLGHLAGKEGAGKEGAGKEGEKLSLDHVEHGILRPTFEDARVHAAVNCASVSCPPLRAEAFRAEILDDQLDEQARAWLADPERNELKRGGPLRVSRIFDWFRSDFERDAGSVQAWIARYAPEQDAAWLRDARDLELRYLDYDWSLNDREDSEQDG